MSITEKSEGIIIYFRVYEKHSEKGTHMYDIVEYNKGTKAIFIQ